MAKNSDTSQRLQQLIAERQRFDEWLQALDTRRDSAPAHVLARVEQDYRERLGKISEELAARADDLRERIGGLQERLTTLQNDEAARRDARAEAELRAAVGEYTEEQWTAFAAEADREVASLAGQRQLLERELAELQQVLDQSTAGRVTGGGPQPAPAAARVTKPAPAAPVAPAAAVAPASAKPVAPAPPRAEPAAASLFDSTAPGSGTMPAAHASRPPRTGKTPAGGASKSSARTEERSEQDKTLKCSECGTLNYPTEWYCESCGAELSTL